jgi:N-acetylneuraminate synthase
MKAHHLITRENSVEERWSYKVGFSNHGYGIASDIAAYTLGAQYFERHFTDDRAMNHTDASGSLEPDGLRRLCRDLKNVKLAMIHKASTLSDEEAAQKAKLKL